MSSAAETLLLKNGRFWTGDPHRPWAEAVLVEGERIRALGSLEEVRKSATGSARETDLEGALGLPGFIDSHVHFMAGGFQLLSVDLRSAQSPEEMARRLGERAGATPAGTWITGG
jgi:predicted amidohydrolase YtcJ